MQTQAGVVSKNIVTSLIFLIVIVVGLCLVYQKDQQVLMTPPDIASGIVLKQPRSLTNFSFTDSQGKTFTPQQLKGHWSLVFFGFTHCPMICPTTLAELNSVYQQLQQQKITQLPEVVMISIDPTRDTVARLRDYIQGFNPNFFAARGSLEQTQQLTQQLGIVFMRSQAKGASSQEYNIDHSGTIVLLNPAGQVQAFFSQPHKAEQIVKDYQQVVSYYQHNNG